MHFLCSPIGSDGDVHPMLGLALELRDRGHAVTFLVSGYHEALIRRYGFEFVEMGTKEEFLASANHPDLWHPMKGFRHIFEEIIEKVLRRQYELFKEHNSPGKTVGISNCLGYGARIAQEKLGMPLVTLHLQPSVIWSDAEPPRLPGQFGPAWLRRWEFRIGERFIVDPLVCPRLNAFRGELGLPPMRRLLQWWHSPWCVACLFPDWYAPPQPDWPENVIQTSFPIWDEPDPAGLPGEVESFLEAGDPPIVFTPGSANLFGKAFFAAALDACTRLGRRGILLTRFADQIPAELPAGIVHFSYVPFSQLLPRVAASVHHGGIGSMSQSMAAGVPQLIMALSHDQFDNGHRVRELGIGDWVKASAFRGPLVARRLDSLLKSNPVAQACSEVAGRLAARDGLSRMAAALERRAEESGIS